ncbi:adenylate/guanylate cyclase domain-containing protein [Maridesulfovibrio zosterae]|uniref:adenylate/guanylate cyclase domain-containing protein n=1 Tax=Maridesulfovibrio zosterae TaxID=82171 RepID=UPI000420927E|nr:adenylate/guanylate cyclase domain-containing protein [Maridesulfovibrio zosterae]
MQKQNRPVLFIVDAIKSEMDFFAKILREDYALLMAMKGSHLFEIVVKEQPDLILLDVDMPEIDVYEVCKNLNGNDATTHIPVILISGDRRTEDEMSGFSAGVVDFIRRPLSPPMVLRRIASALIQKEQTYRLADLSDKLGRYLSPQVYESIFAGTQDSLIGAKRKKLTIFFSDIVGFTSTTERMEPEDMTSLLNSYLDRMASIALKHGGTIDKYIGDAVLIFFGDPVSKGYKNDALACVDMAIEMRDALKEMQQEWFDIGISTPFKVRMGINTGFCTVGNFGSKQLMDYTIIGGQVNVAARLEQNAPPDQILISHETWALVKDDFRCLGRAPIYVKGVQHSIRTYQVIGRGLTGSQDSSSPLGEMVWPARTVTADQTVADAMMSLRESGEWSCLIVLDGVYPIGMITKGRMDEIVRKETDKALFFQRPVTTVMDKELLVLPDESSLDKVARNALSREGNYTFDPIAVTRNGEFAGLVSVRCLMQRLLAPNP